jgi:Domain of unknown function (DUF5086)
MSPFRRSALAVVTIIAAFSRAPFASSVAKFTEGSIWMLPATSNELRWVEIHKAEGVGSDALYHISVLSRGKADPVWNLKHVVAHMAITGSALSRSVAPRASRMGAAYPETYDEGYRAWLALREKGNAPICETTVMECAHLSVSP